MASESVVDEGVAVSPATNCGIENDDHLERIISALDGIEAIGAVVQCNIDGDMSGFWSDAFISHLTEGAAALVAFARQEAKAMNHELWHMHALAGDYGVEPQARARRESDVAQETQA